MQGTNLGLHSIMVLRHGHVVAEGWWHPYDKDQPHMLFSMTKSFTAIATGFAVSEGLLSVEDQVASFFSELFHEEFSEALAALRIKHLLTMSVGHAKATMGQELRQLTGSWVEHFFSIPIDHAPGSRFVYNTLATHIISAVIQKVTGMKMSDYLQPRLFDPLGIPKPEWQISPDGNNTGGGGLKLRTEEIAKFGQFLLQKGVWEGERLLPEEWIEKVSSFQIKNGENNQNDSEQGYGYQFWRCRHGAFRADGAFGQLCIVMPDQDAVVAITSGVDLSTGSKQILSLIWTHLLPSMKSQPIAEEEELVTRLQEKLSGLSVLFPSPTIDTSPIISKISGKWYAMDKNEDHVKEIAILFEQDCCLFIMRDHEGEHQISCGFREWIHGSTTMTGKALHFQYQPPVMSVCGRAAWKDQHTLVLTWCFVEMPFTDTVICRFTEDQVRLERSANVSGIDRERPAIVGALA
ncbi:beta-lactamase family protein [Paenibacillus doosanensis]|nr:beta-lactamase family protein [Paenibacillus doosanensis]